MNRLHSAMAVLIAVGGIGLAIGFARAPLDAWVWLVFNFVCFTGITNGVLVWSAVFRTSHTKWTPVIRRLGMAAIAFAPASFIALVALLAGAREFVPWVSRPVPEKAAWLNLPFMAVRDIVSMVVLWMMFLLMVRWELTLDAKMRRGEQAEASERFNISAVATAAVITYTITGSIIAYDFIMSLTPQWYSTMFAPYIWITNAYAGLAVLILICAAVRRKAELAQWLQPQQFKDLGNLMLGFSLFSMGLFFAQYLTIWYENLPDEVPFLILRYDRGAWPPIGWLSFVLAYGLPFIALQSRAVKLRAGLLSAVAIMALVGFAIERYVLIVPSIEPGKLMLYPVSVLSVLAFAGAFVLAVAIFLRRYSAENSEFS